MDMKNLSAIVSGIVGGLFVGFGLGFQYATGKMAGLITPFATEVGQGLNSDMGLAGQLLGMGMSQGLQDYTYQNVMNPLPVIVLGLVAITAGVLITRKHGMTAAV